MNFSAYITWILMRCAIVECTFSLAILCIMILGIWNILSNDSNWFAKEVREDKTQSALKDNTLTCPKFMNESKTNNAVVSKPN